MCCEEHINNWVCWLSYTVFIILYSKKIMTYLLRRFWRSGDRASWKILIIKPTRCANFSNLFLEWKSTCFGQFLCPSSGVFHWAHNNGICHTGLLCVQWRTPDDGQRNCSKHAEFHSKNKFEKLVHSRTSMTYTIVVCPVKNSWWWTEELSETCRVLFQK